MLATDSPPADLYRPAAQRPKFTQCPVSLFKRAVLE